MVKRFATITAVAAILTAASGASADQTFKARMSEEQEVPTPIGQGTTGKFEIQFNRDFTEGEYKLVINSGTRIHAGPSALRSGRRGRAGHHLPRRFHRGRQQAGGGGDVDGQWITNATVTNANIGSTPRAAARWKRLSRIARPHGNVYVNAHSVVNPPGVARGQLEGN